MGSAEVIYFEIDYVAALMPKKLKLLNGVAAMFAFLKISELHMVIHNPYVR